jgi:hypothetical protein
VAWDIVDFTVFGAMLLGVGVIYTLASAANNGHMQCDNWITPPVVPRVPLPANVL